MTPQEPLLPVWQQNGASRAAIPAMAGISGAATRSTGTRAPSPSVSAVHPWWSSVTAVASSSPGGGSDDPTHLLHPAISGHHRPLRPIRLAGRDHVAGARRMPRRGAASSVGRPVRATMPIALPGPSERLSGLPLRRPFLCLPAVACAKHRKANRPT
jgi:hypothetical protein